VSKIWAFAALVAAIVLGAAGLKLGGVFDQPAPSVVRPGPVTASPAGVANAAATADDRVLGRADAKVTLIEYASLTCGHCAEFHTAVLPKLKTAFIDTGKVRLIFRDFPLDEMALRASALAHCIGPDRYFAFLDVLFTSQASWARSNDPAAALNRLAKLGGMSEQQIETCQADKALTDRILAVRLQAAQQYKIDSTPTFIINGTKHSGGYRFEDLERVINALL
jgi:protein-disulfide isomerase